MRGSVLVAVAALAVAGCGEAPEDGGPGAVEAMVRESCAPGGDPVETEVCECAYAELDDRFDDAALERLDRELRDDPETVPAEVREVVLECGFARVSPPTTKPPTTTVTTETTASSTTSTSTTGTSTTTSTTTRPSRSTTTTIRRP